MTDSTFVKADNAWLHDGRMILAYKNELLQSIDNNSLSYRIIYYDDQETEAAKSHLQLASQCLEFYQSKLLRRQLPRKQLVFFRPKYPINDGWSFIRDGITICGNPLKDDEIEAASLVSHELAHTWSHGAPMNWEDWLNESFAEYGSMLFIEERFGRKAYERKVHELLEVNQKWYHMQPIKPKNGTERPNSVHTKGAIVFDVIRTKYGNDAILSLIRIFDALEAKNTDNLIGALRDGNMGEVAEFLERKIHEPI